MKTFLMTSVALAFATLSHAQEAVDCDWPARADAIVEPWEDYSRTFANGDVRLALLDTVEPAAAAFHILILSPPYDEIGARQCRTLGMGGAGFAGVTFEALDAAYDPSVGLIFEVPVSTFDGNSGDFETNALLFTLNQATGQIDAWLD
jgi:hypothetical protein